MRIVVILLLFLALPAIATQQTFSSGDRQVNVIELFTSEGCSSCPPAERWLNTLQQETNLWTKFVPIAFHVDYWDYIGWKDSFATPQFNARQHRYAAQGGTRFVYTPGMFRNGEEWLGWRSGESVVGTRHKAAQLSITRDGDRVEATFSTQEDGPWILNVAIVGMGLETTVHAGENRGRTLKHDFVALDLQSMPLEKTGAEYHTQLNLPIPESDAVRHGIVGWVSRPKQQSPVQATGGFIDTR